jgi:hypothetical protein
MLVAGQHPEHFPFLKLELIICMTNSCTCSRVELQASFFRVELLYIYGGGAELQAFFYLDVAYVSHICCKSMFHLFQSYVAASVFMYQVSVLSESCICYNGYTRML